jgi:hypothetical protein
MKKTLLILAILSIGVLGFTQATQEDKKVKLELTVEEVNLVYVGLGKLPAEASEALRYKIAQEAQKQLGNQEAKK